MESFGGFNFNDKNQTMRKKRSDRRPRNDIPLENEDSSLSSSPPSDNGSKGLIEDNAGGKILNLNHCNSRASYTNLADSDMARNGSSEFGNQESSDDKDTGVDTSEVFASNYKDIIHNSGSMEVNSVSKGVDNVVKKVKLKVGGVVRTIHAKSNVLKPPPHSTGNRLKQKPTSQENSDQDTGNGLRGIPWKDFSRSGFRVGKTDSSSNDLVYKSKLMPRRGVLGNDDYDDDDEDDAELRYLAKMKSKSAKIDDEDEVGSKKQRKISSVLKMDSKKKPKTGRESEDSEYYTGEESASVDFFGQDSSREMTITTRRQALQSGRDISTDSTTSVVEFPHGLPPAPPRKQKEKLSDVEHQLKKAEAAQRRKIQAAKAARESEAEAIRKILGQDSSRKKRENKLKQRQEEMAQERNSNAAMLASNTVRWVIRPTGTVVTFSADIGLPNIFESRVSSYPPPREKCAGPSCSEPFKYRDSRSKLPLCSLQCYKAIQEKKQPGSVY